MTRTLIDVDDVALAKAAALLGTRTKVETINNALRAVTSQAEKANETSKESDRFRDFVKLIGQRLSEVDVRREAWR
jgi:Arc/MetJ family transcription regulator